MSSLELLPDILALLPGREGLLTMEWLHSAVVLGVVIIGRLNVNAC